MRKSDEQAPTTNVRSLQDTRVAALQRAATRRTEDAEKAAEKGIRTLIKDGGRISFAAVARNSGLSKSFLHAHPDLSHRIRDLAARQHGITLTAHDQELNGESAVVAALRRHVTDLETRHTKELRELRRTIRDQERHIAALHGQIATHESARSRATPPS